MEIKPDISFFLGGIRPQNWTRLYQSIEQSIHPYKFELVICGPYAPEKINSFSYNFKFIRDFGSAARAAQIAALNSESSLITLSADDGIYEPGSMAKALEQFRNMEGNKKVLALRYEEGGNEMYKKDWYWYMKAHDKMQNLAGIPNDTPMSLNSIMTKELFIDIGGYDCNLFETCNWGGHDLMIRLHKYGITFEQFKQKNLSVTWSPVETEEHRPIYLSDHPPESTSNYHVFKHIWSNNNERVKTDINSWTKAQSTWSKRFK